MYDPARDIFTENTPSSSPPPDGYDHSALDTLADIAAEAEVASLPGKQDSPTDSMQDVVSETAHDPVTEKETANHVESGNEAVPEGGAEVARTKQPDLSLKVTLHLRREGDKPKRKEMQAADGQDTEEAASRPAVKEEKIMDEGAVSTSPAKESSPKSPSKWQSSKSESPRDAIQKKDDSAAQDDVRNEKRDNAYPIPLSLDRLGKIPKRKTEDRRDKPDRDQNRSQASDRERRQSAPHRSPQYVSRSPSNRPRTPPRRLSDDRFRPNPPLIDSYRPSRDQDDSHVPSKRPRSRSPSPSRQLKRPIRRDITTSDRERERRERQLREAERQKAELETVRSRPVYESVRQHYNDREDRGREARQESRIFRLRKFNNWIKSVLIGKFIPERTEEEMDEGRGLFVLDIGCGKGGDLLKWQKQPQVQAYVGVDIAEVSVIHAEQRAAEMRGRRFSTRFFAMDCFVDPIRSRLTPNYPLFDVVSMQFVMHYAFESEEKARTMLMNVSKNLRRGGYFIGTIPSSDAIIEGIKSLPPDSREFGNSIYSIRFPERPTQTVFRPPFGHRYNFFMEDAVGNVPEYIVPFEVFRGLAEDANLELVYKRTFHEIYEDEKDEKEFGRLLDRMGVVDEDGDRGLKGEEWDAVGIYLAFAFEKRGGY